MEYNVNYLTDSRGRRRSVVLSMADWKKMQHELERARVKADLREALHEIREMEAGRQPAVTLLEFLKEWDDEQVAANGQ